MQQTIFIIALILGLTSCSTDKHIQSPEGNITVTVNESEGNINYSISKNNQEIISKSLLGIVVDGQDLSINAKIDNIEASSSDETCCRKRKLHLDSESKLRNKAPSSDD